MSFLSNLMRVSRALGVIACLSAAVLPTSAADMKLEARLIWGTDTETNGNNRVQDQRLTEALAGIFRWKNYYEITNRAASIAQDAMCSLEMSSKCLLKIKNIGGSRIEVSFFGDGKSINKGIHSLPQGKWLTLAGSVQNDSAWFIVMRSASGGSPAQTPPAPKLPGAAEDSTPKPAAKQPAPTEAAR